MKTYFTIFALLITSALLLFQAVNQKGFTNQVGAPAGRAASPFDFSGLTCTEIGCHNSFPLGTRQGWITSNIPGTGYVPGQTYTITATASSPNRVRFGFEISPQTATGGTAGTVIITNVNQTRLAAPPNIRWVTHTSAGSFTAAPGSKSWNFNWTAPAAGTGTVTFYGAFNCANNNASSLGDSIFTSQMEVEENLSTAILAAGNNAFKLLLYPNPASTHINVGYNLEETEELILSIYDAMGKRIWMAPVTQPPGKHNMALNLADTGIHEKGIYFIEIKTKEKSFSSRFMVL